MLGGVRLREGVLSRNLVSGSWDDTVRVWEAATGREVPVGCLSLDGCPHVIGLMAHVCASDDVVRSSLPPSRTNISIGDLLVTVDGTDARLIVIQRASPKSLVLGRWDRGLRFHGVIGHFSDCTDPCFLDQ